MTRVLVVCIGNVCRSPLAERLLTARAPHLQVTSAGVQGMVGSPMEPTAAGELVRLGGDPSGFTATLLEPAHVEAADLVLAATKDVRTQVLQVSPRAMRRTFTLLELAALVSSPALADQAGADLVAGAHRLRPRVADRPLDLTDPMGEGATVHRRVADEIAAAVDTVAAALSR